MPHGYKDILEIEDTISRVEGVMRRKKWTISTLARKLDCTYPQAFKMMRSQTAWKFPVTYARVAEAIGVDWKYLIIRNMNMGGRYFGRLAGERERKRPKEDWEE